ncbi:MAG: PEP-CTERM sorting domain-containing protein [Isosphaeraceae bacterium]|nr:PEP-CTERM sorting domain-containing protein [Isosphaeraceae bacterium]
MRTALNRLALAVASWIALGFGPAARAEPLIGINFAGGGGPGSPSTLNPTDLAGVVPQMFWNNAAGASGVLANLSGAEDGTPVATAISVTWSSNNTWSTGIPLTTPNNRLMEGYLDTGSTTHTLVTVSGIPLSVYDVYVYTDGDNPETRVGSYTIAGVTQTTTDPAGVNFNGTFILGQNYTVFTGLTGSSFTLDATPLAVGGAPRAPVNGVQIVPSAIPEPSTLVLGGTAVLFGLGSAWRRRRAGRA